MKRPWLVGSLCLVVVGLGTIGVRHESRAELQRALSSLRANLPPDSRFEYDRAYPRFFARGAGFDNARFIRGNTILRAHVLTISNPQGYLSTGLSVSRIHAESVTLEGDVTGKIDNLTVSKLLLPPITREKRDITGLPPASQIHFRHGQLHGVDIDKISAGCHVRIGGATLDNYGHDEGNNSAWHNVSVFCPPNSMASLAASSIVHREAGAISLDVKDDHMTGFRLAHLIEWGEARSSGNNLPLAKIQTKSLWEPQSGGEMLDMVFSIMGTRLKIQESSMKQWKEGDLIRNDSETKNVSVTNLSGPINQILPDGIKIADIHNNHTVNTETGLSKSGLEASTPGLFTYVVQIEGTHFEPRTLQEKPELTQLLMSYEDKGNTINTLMQRVADFRHVSLDQLRMSMLVPLAMIAQAAPGLSALPGFLQNPQGHRITLTLHPPKPLIVGPESFAALGATLKTSASARQLWLSPPVLTTSLN